MRIGVIGSGEVGRTLASGLKKHGYEVRIGSRSPSKLADYSKSSGVTAATFADVAAWGEAAVLAVGGEVAEQALRDAGAANLKGKPVIDVTNPSGDEPPADGGLRCFAAQKDP